MQLFLDGIEQPLAGAAPHDLVIGPAGVRVRLSLPPGEELAAAALTLRRYAGSGAPPLSPPVVATNHAGGSLSSITWITADWGSARALRSIALDFAGASNLRVRVQIARGAGAWYAPPGPHTFDPANGTNISATARFPDTVADRVMLELLDRTSGQPTTATLRAPPALSFGTHARDLAMRVTGRRDSFTHPGELPAGGVGPRELLDNLRAAAGGPVSGMDIELELRAAVAGFAGIEWSFAHTTIVRGFADDSDIHTLDLPWDQPVIVPLAALPPNSRPASVALAATFAPVRQRLAISPAPARLRQAVAALVRPLHDSAQAFQALARPADALGDELGDEPGDTPIDTPIVGVDLWARPLSRRIDVRVALHPDRGGQPADAPFPGLTGTHAIDLGDHGELPPAPAWLSVPLDAPALLPARTSRFWLVVQVDDGELLWFLDSARPQGAGTVRHRRNQGPWLDHEATAPGAWALTRLRVRDNGPPPPLDATLCLVAANGSATELPLPADAGGMRRWQADAPVPAATRVDLRLRARAAGAVTLSRLRLTYRETP